MTFTPSTTNPNAPFGLRPVKYDEKLLVHCYLPSTDANIHYLNMPVQLDAAGANAAAAPNNGTQIGALPIIATAGSTGVFFGSIVGFVGSSSANENYVYNPASTAREVIVCADPNAIYEMQMSGNLAATDVGLNTNLISPASGSSITGLSAAALDSSLTATTSTLQLRILSLVNSTDNILGSYSRVLCKINNTNNTPNTAGI